MKNNPLSADAGIYYIESVDSTMLEARRMASKGALSGTVIRTGFQSAGRGRIKDRKWESFPGDSLMFTVIFSKADLALRMSGRPYTLLPLLCGLAVAEVLSGISSGAEIRLKWPNDVLADGRKLCGILCEASGPHIYAGIGINLNQSGFPDGLRRPACSLKMLGIVLSAESLLYTVLEQLDKVLKMEDWRQAVEKHLYLLGRRISFKTGPADDNSEGSVGAVISGCLAGVNNSGALLIETKDGITEAVSGELLI